MEKVLKIKDKVVNLYKFTDESDFFVLDKSIFKFLGFPLKKEFSKHRFVSAIALAYFWILMTWNFFSKFDTESFCLCLFHFLGLMKLVLMVKLDENYT
jgi:hypothetical protein